MRGKWVRCGTLVALAVFALSIAGCAGSGGGTTSESAAASASTVKPVPSNSKLAQVDLGMTDTQVRKVMGDPDNSRNYMTGKAWIPFYFGGDTHRSEWHYSGVGQVVFSRNRWSGSLTVIDRIYDPSQP